MFAELGMGSAALISAAGGIYAVVVSRSTREATTRKTASEAADIITQASARAAAQLQEQIDKMANRNKELVTALNALTDLLDEILEGLSHDGVVLGIGGCDDRRADIELIKKLREANRRAKIAT